MANYYTDIPELKFHLNNPMMKRICELKERNYRDKDEFDYAPLDFEDAVDSYDKVLEITGEITGEIIAANAEGVDEEGPHCANGRVEYASGTKQNLDAMVKAGLNGMTMPRRFGDLLIPLLFGILLLTHTHIRYRDKVLGQHPHKCRFWCGIHHHCCLLEMRQPVHCRILHCSGSILCSLYHQH